MQGCLECFLYSWTITDSFQHQKRVLPSQWEDKTPDVWNLKWCPFVQKPATYWCADQLANKVMFRMIISCSSPDKEILASFVLKSWYAFMENANSYYRMSYNFFGCRALQHYILSSNKNLIHFVTTLITPRCVDVKTCDAGLFYCLIIVEKQKILETLYYA